MSLPFLVDRREGAAAWALSRWGVLGALVGVLSGVAAALFLHALNGATSFRELHPYLLLGLPIAGVAIGGVYQHYGKSVVTGNNLLLDRIHSPEAAAIPFRMAPLVLVATVVTHLFGGSAGREGTAIQMGGTLAGLLAAPLKLSARDRRLLLMSGISGGFGAVFGTPIAGAVFGLEVLTIGRIDYEALVPCLAASVVGDVVCRGLGIRHHLYAVGVLPPSLAPVSWLLILVAGVLFGVAATVFSLLTHGISHAMSRRVSRPWLRPVIGGSAVVALTFLVGTRDYLGLSLPLIEKAFTPGGVVLWAFAFKILFTAITLGTGFKGGEVTPLFCIGATLGAGFAHLTGQPTGFFAAMGFVAVFAGAANTPLACTILGIELFGSAMAVPIAAACVVAYTVSGHHGIYLSQHLGIHKIGGTGGPNESIPCGQQDGSGRIQ